MSRELKSLLSPGEKAQGVKRALKSDRTRAAILESALTFIWSHPFRDMTVSSLMGPTGVGRSTFYRYFRDLHEVMETLLETLQDDILAATQSWRLGTGDPVAIMEETIAGLVRVCYQRGPILRAISDAAATDERLEKAWRRFISEFDDAAVARIQADQAQGLIPRFDALPVSIALTRLNAYTIIESFGQRPRKKPEAVQEALARVWISTLYGSEFVGKKHSNAVRK